MNHLWISGRDHLARPVIHKWFAKWFESPRESLFKDRYFESDVDADLDADLDVVFKDPALNYIIV